MNRSAIALVLLSTACSNEATIDLQEARETLQNTRATVDHGALPLSAPVDITLDKGSTSHRFAVTFTTPATLHAWTRAASDGGQVDTVLSLYRAGAKSSSQPLARSDDANGTRFSDFTRSLSAGDYVLEVAGFKRSTRGTFQLSATCEGSGCPVLTTGCLFGSTFSDLRNHPALAIESETWIRSVSELSDDVERAQLVLAVQQSSHTDVTTAEQALERVDQNEVRWMELSERAGSRAFTVVEYGAGDNSYGAIFEAGTVHLVASIHDGDLLDCSIR